MVTNRIANITIPSGASISAGFNKGLGDITSLGIPSNLQGVTSVTISSSESESGTYNVYATSAGVPYSFTLVASSDLSVDINLFRGLKSWIKLISNTAPSADLVIGVYGN